MCTTDELGKERMSDICLDSIIQAEFAAKEKIENLKNISGLEQENIKMLYFRV